MMSIAIKVLIYVQHTENYLLWCLNEKTFVDTFIIYIIYIIYIVKRVNVISRPRVSVIFKSDCNRGNCLMYKASFTWSMFYCLIIFPCIDLCLCSVS